MNIELVNVLQDNADIGLFTDDDSHIENFYQYHLFYIASYIVNRGDYIHYGDTWINFFSNEYQAFYENSALGHLIFTSTKLFSEQL